jgi:hypothetical protein
MTPDQMDATNRKEWVDRVLKQWEDRRLKEIRDTHRDRALGDARVESFPMGDEDYKKYELIQASLASQNQISTEDREWYQKQKLRLNHLREYHGQERFDALKNAMGNPWWSNRKWWTKPEYWEIEEQKEKQRKAYEKLNENHKAEPWEHNSAWWEQWKGFMTTSNIQDTLRQKRKDRIVENLAAIKSRLIKVKNALGLPATIWASLSAYTPVCSMLIAFRQQWKPHREYLQSHSLMEKDREFNAWKQQKRHEMMQAQKMWEEEKSVGEAKREQEKKTKSPKKWRVDGNSRGPKTGVESSKDDKSLKEEWGEPFPNWNEFELFLKYGRRWRYGRRWKMALQQFKKLKPGEDSSPQTLTDPVSTTTPAAEDQPPPAWEQPPRQPALPKPNLTDSEEYNPTALIHQPRTPNEEEIADKIRKKLYKNKEQVIEDGWWSYEFLGECYIHGMMDGEAMAFQNETAQPAHVFELR